MKNKVVFLIVFVIGAWLTGCRTQPAGILSVESVPEEPADKNMIRNGDFKSGLKGWSLYTLGGSARQTVTGGGEMEIAVAAAGPLEHSVQPYYDGFSLEKGCVYEFSFDVHSTIERTVQWRLQLNGGDYHAYVSDLISIGTEVRHISRTFTMEEESDKAPRLCVNMGLQPGCPADMGAHSVYFDNFALYLLDDSNLTESAAAVKKIGVNCNQAGYLPDAVKKAVVRDSAKTPAGGSFTVVDAATGEAVYTGPLSGSSFSAACGERTATADFSQLTRAGTYKVVTESGGESFPFEIGAGVYDSLAASVLRMFYLQRCGTEIADAVFGHKACHTGRAVVYGDESGAAGAVTGGWHDAGDYGRYTVAGAKAAADLMLAWEAFGPQFGDDTGIPESGNGVPDILDEVKYELDWLLMMQNPETGGVYHKITCAAFPDTVMPEKETDQLILSPVSTTATADFAAVTAMASRIFSAADPSYQAVCLNAAEKAWGYLRVTPGDSVGFRNPDSISTGAYDDRKDTDERFWALAELYKATGKSEYLSELKKYKADDVGSGLGWQDVGAYGMYAYLTCGGRLSAHQKKIAARFSGLADEAAAKSETDAYGAAMGEHDYCWGSNMSVANAGMLLLMAERLAPKSGYAEAAGRQLDYLLGTNTNSYCFVTGFGTLSPLDPHHRPSQAKGRAAPGMLVGGPDADLDDPYAAGVLAEEAPAACYADSARSYSCNEVTIYWNSPLVYLLAGVKAE